MTTQTEKPLILVICDYYLPGFESGGAMRTIVNMVDRLADEFRFRIVTRDHDGPLNRAPYDSVTISDWNRVGNADVYYLAEDKIGRSELERLITEVKPNAIYVNSFFSPLTIFTLMLRRFGKIPPVPIVLAPEGEFSAGALGIKSVKKKLYIRGAKLLKLLDKLIWKTASENEAADLKRVIGAIETVFVAPNLPPRMIDPNYDQAAKPEKHLGDARLVFLSRFMRKKNFNWLLEQLREVSGELTIDIYGPREEPDYWKETEELIEKLPKNITVHAKGPVPYQEVPKTLAKYHFFVLPTLGENFGHIFVEALAAGCPLIISDRTPWRDLEAKDIGWDMSLDEPSRWIAAINTCLAMEQDEYTQMSGNARRFAVDWLSDPEHEKANREMLRFAAGSN